MAGIQELVGGRIETMVSRESKKGASAPFCYYCNYPQE
jgi:hypothetical protein